MLQLRGSGAYGNTPTSDRRLRPKRFSRWSARRRTSARAVTGAIGQAITQLAHLPHILLQPDAPDGVEGPTKQGDGLPKGDANDSRLYSVTIQMDIQTLTLTSRSQACERKRTHMQSQSHHLGRHRLLLWTEARRTLFAAPPTSGNGGSPCRASAPANVRAATEVCSRPFLVPVAAASHDLPHPAWGGDAGEVGRTGERASRPRLVAPGKGRRGVGRPSLPGS